MKYLFVTFVIFSSLPVVSQTSAVMKAYKNYKANEITHRRFKQSDVFGSLDKLGDQFTITELGRSVEGRSIKMVSVGAGPINVLMWSQMHGNEPTATQALLDLVQFLAADDEYNGLRKRMREQLTMHFIPMLNPDGAQYFQRRNMQGIDINRDALRQQTPEGVTLKKVRDSLNADWGFNLHDQSRYTQVGQLPASISFLAPAYDYDLSINEVRGDAMKLIVVLNRVAQQYVPNQVGRYWDDFEPRAFGDNIQKWGTRTILIESGGYQGDREKQYLREVNFALLLTALDQISSVEFKSEPVSSYESIPNNANGRLHDLIIKNINWKSEYITDVAIRQNERENIAHDDYYLVGAITDVGDLSTATSYEAFDASDYIAEAGKMYRSVLSSEEFGSLNVHDLIKEGITDVRISDGFDPFARDNKLKIHEAENAKVDERIAPGANPSMVFRKNGKIVFTLINGTLIKID
ncbi:MAG: peptidase M14 [Cyclobacteriaceae bacterium]